MGEVTTFTRVQRSHRDTNTTSFTSSLWRNDVQRGERFCQQVLRNVCVRSSAHQPHSGLLSLPPSLSPVSFDKPNASEVKTREESRFV